MNRRGTYHVMYSALIDDLDFKRLTAPARHVLLTLRFCPENTRASIFRWHPAVLREQTALRPSVIERALVELSEQPTPEAPWIVRDQHLVWIRNGLRFDPTMNLTDKKHRDAVVRILEGLPKSEVVVRFCEYYQGLEPSFDFRKISGIHKGPPKGLPRPFEGVSTGIGTGTGTRKGTGSPKGEGEGGGEGLAEAPQASAHPIKALLTVYGTLFETRFGERPNVTGKDANLAKGLLAKYPAQKLETYLAAFFESDDAFIANSGYGFGVFVSCLNKVIAQNGRPRLSAKTQGNLASLERFVQRVEGRKP